VSKNLHPVFQQLVRRWDMVQESEPFTDTDSLLAAGGDPSATPVEDCQHSWFRVSGADRWRCTHCGTIRILNDL